MAFTLRKAQSVVSNSKDFKTDNQMNINCVIKKFIYKDSESGFYVFSAVIPTTYEPVSAIVGKKEFKGREFKVVGTSEVISDSVVEGQELEIWGSFEEGEGRGADVIQFKAKVVEEKIPTKPKAIYLFLSSGKLRGIGKKIAQKIVDKFGPRTIEVLDNTPELLLEVEGINQKKLEMAMNSWKEWRAKYEVISTMREYGIGDSASIKVFNYFGNNAINTIKENPYDLTEVKGIGFRTADSIGQKAGKLKTDPKRIEKCILFILEEIADSGNTACAQIELLNKAVELLDVDVNLVKDSINLMVKNELLISKDVEIKTFKDNSRKNYTITKVAGIAHHRFYEIEKNIANELKRILIAPNNIERDLDLNNIKNFIEENPFKLDKSQLKAVQVLLPNKVSVLTGGPGTGKTHTIKSLISFYESLDINAVYCSADSDESLDFQSMDLSCVLSAPTGMAAKRMQKLTTKPSSTIHRLLDYKEGEFTHNQFNKLSGDIFIIDESSMIDVWLLNSLLKAIPSNAKLILVGDVDQLSSVGAGKALKDIIESCLIPVIRLTDIHRQAADSQIILAAHSIINNKMPTLYSIEDDKDFAFIEKEGSESVRDSIIEVINNLKKNNVNSNNIQILTPKKDGIVGVQNLNKELRPLLNDYYHTNYEEDMYIPGDRVMQLKNNKELDIYNGDVGYVINANEDDGVICVEFDNRNIELNDYKKNLALSFAITIHKSQGSDYPYVIIPITKANSFMWDANLLYTAVTRAKFKVILIGDKKTIFQSVSSYKQKERITNLKDEIINAFKDVDLSNIVYEKDIDPSVLTKEEPKKVGAFKLGSK